MYGIEIMSSELDKQLKLYNLVIAKEVDKKKCKVLSTLAYHNL